MIETIEFKGHIYPKFQASGNAARFIYPFAQEVCKGRGVDIGCSKKEWCFPGAICVDIDFDDEYDALNLPEGEFDYIFSSHCLEHIPNWASALDYWTSKLKSGGVLFLYLPHESQIYWRPYHNRKHFHQFRMETIWDYLEYSGSFSFEMVSNVDLNNSFAVMAQKR